MALSYINPLLPEKFIPKQHLMLYYYDIIADLLYKADEFSLNATQLQFSNEDNKPDKDDDIFDWLKENEHEEVNAKVLSPHLFFSLLTDFSYYISESLNCIEKGKVTVAYTLSRKPFQDSLFYLCWLLAEPVEFMDTIQNKDVGKYDVSNFKRNKNKLKKIFENANEKLTTDFDFDIDLIVELIYEKESDIGLSGIWDKSIHLVTGNKFYRTETGNLNFVFADDKIWNTFWETYYDKFPLLLYFSLEICIKIFEKILNIPNAIILLNQYLRTYKTIRFHNLMDKNSILKYQQDMESILPPINVICEQCDHEYLLEGDVMKEFIDDPLFTCPRCGFVDRPGHYWIDDELLMKLRNERVVNISS